MDWYQILKSIYVKLEDAGFQKERTDFIEAELSGGTAGEIFDIVLSELEPLRAHKPKVYKVIEEEVNVLLDNSKTIGYRR